MNVPSRWEPSNQWASEMRAHLGLTKKQFQGISRVQWLQMTELARRVMVNEIKRNAPKIAERRAQAKRAWEEFAQKGAS